MTKFEQHLQKLQNAMEMAQRFMRHGVTFPNAVRKAAFVYELDEDELSHKLRPYGY